MICAGIMSFGIYGYLNSAIILMTELGSENLRNLAPNVLYLGWAVGHMLVVPFYYLFPEFYVITMVLCCIPILGINFIFKPTPSGCGNWATASGQTHLDGCF